MSGINGIIAVNKPQGYTSFDVAAICRRAYGTRKVGHGGTLDPMATGVLPIFFGAATKAVDFTPAPGKAYTAGFKLGVTTDTLDITGTITSERGFKSAAKADIEAVLPKFTGDIMQTPPMYSAVKVGGRRLYDLARAGVTAKRAPRPVTVKSLSLTQYENGEGTLEIICGGGTYVRVIIADIGEALGCGAVMTSLVRTLSHGFTLKDCADIEAVKAGDLSDAAVTSLEKFYEKLPSVRLTEEQARIFGYGCKLSPELSEFSSRNGGSAGKHDGIYAAYTGGHIVGLCDSELTFIQRFNLG